MAEKALAKKPEFLTKELAAERLGLSVRRLMELSFGDDPAIARHMQIDPVTRRDVVMFKASEVQEYGEALAARAAAAPRPAPPAARPQLLLGTPEMFGAQAAAPRPAWITIAEAASESGLPDSAIDGLIRSGKLPALDVGVRPGGRYRINRAELEGLRGERIAS